MSGRGLRQHTQYSRILIVLKDSDMVHTRKLQGAWVVAPLVPGALLVNIGDMAQRQSNDVYRRAVTCRSGFMACFHGLFHDEQLCASAAGASHHIIADLCIPGDQADLCIPCDQAPTLAASLPIV